MPSLNPLQKVFLKAFLTKLLVLPPFYFFFKAIYPIFRYPLIDPFVYIMLTLFDWISLMLCIFGVAAIELLIANPELRQRLWAARHLERKGLPAIRRDKEKKEDKNKKLPIF